MKIAFLLVAIHLLVSEWKFKYNINIDINNFSFDSLVIVLTEALVQQGFIMYT